MTAQISPHDVKPAGLGLLGLDVPHGPVVYSVQIGYYHVDRGELCSREK